MASCPICGWEATEKDRNGSLLVCSSCHVTTPLPGAKIIPFLRSDAPPTGEIPLPGDFTKHYQLLRVLGVGNTGSMWLARSLTTNHQLVVRFHLPFADFERMDRFIREGKTLSQIHHPNLRQIVETGELAGFPYLITEYLEGTALSRGLAQGRVAGEAVPNHADAYLERAGAYYHLNDMTRSRADAQHACDMGLAEGCTILKHMDAKSRH
jgi:serine/threonine protein kinase